MAAARYRAFISYSHRDAAFGRRLHRRLERYVLPGRLVGRATARGEVPRRIAPIFRDREELSAASDLTAEVRAALAASGALIVVCSPAAAASPWVSREVDLFRALHPDGPVLAALASGEPAEAFPDCLRTVDAAGAQVEPLAADFRPEGDGPRLALLKLVAGVVGVGLDELVQRDAQRRLRSVTAVTAGALAGMLAMGALAAFALASRAEAQRQRGEAEALVEFMLTDLRDRLKGVGRLDVLTAVNARALSYYADQDLPHLPAASLERRARVLHAMGEDDLARGNADAALTEFSEARRVTAALLAENPNDPERIFAHAQSEHWVGYVDYRAGRRAAAAKAWDSYQRLAARLVALEPRNWRFVREAAYAAGDVCSLALKPPRQPQVAVPACALALRDMERASSLPGAERMERDLANRHAWLSRAYWAAKDPERGAAERLEEEKILQKLVSENPNDMAVKERWISLERALAAMERVQQRFGDARSRLAAVLPVLDRMITFDPANEVWRRQRENIRTEIQTNQSVYEEGASQ